NYASKLARFVFKHQISVFESNARGEYESLAPCKVETDSDILVRSVLHHQLCDERCPPLVDLEREHSTRLENVRAITHNSGRSFHSVVTAEQGKRRFPIANARGQ